MPYPTLAKVEKMSQRHVPRNGKPAAPKLATAWLLVCAAALSACGPQTVPSPIRPRLGRDGYGSTPMGTSSGSLPAAGRLGGAAGTVSTTGSPVGGDTATLGAGGGPNVVVTPTGGTAGAIGSNAELPPFEAGTDLDRNHVLPGGLCARLAVIQCAAERHCCRAPGRTNAECQTSLKDVCETKLYLDVIANNPITGFDPNAALMAFTELENRSAQCDVGIPKWSLSSAGIRGILKGTRASGVSCKPSTAELNDGPAQAAALASCLNSDVTPCWPRSALSPWECVPRNPAGSGCATDENCNSDTYCLIPSGGRLGNCAPRVPDQGTCTVGAECYSLFCSGRRCVPPDTQLVFCPAG